MSTGPSSGLPASPPRGTLESISFNAGPNPGSDGLDVDATSVVVLVGPNNSGKSTALREIGSAIPAAVPIPQIVVQGTSVALPGSVDELLELLAPFRREHPPASLLPSGVPLTDSQVFFEFPQIGGLAAPISGPLVGGVGPVLERDGLEHSLRDPTNAFIRQLALNPLTLILDGQSRLGLVTQTSLGDLQGPAVSHLAALFRDDNARARLREISFEAFGRYVVLDPTQTGHVRIRLSDRPPADVEEERGLSERSLDFHARAALIDERGDGVKAYIGLITAVLALPHRVILIDEPEAFLHPPLRRRLGRRLAELAAQRTGCVVAATHSSDFLIGCVSAGVDVTIVRLTYDGAPGTATTRVLPASSLRALMRDPLLRSSRVLDGLFYRGVVVCEGDSDRVFYDEINARLQEHGRGIDDALFVNAHNWQSTGPVAAALRRLGVPAAIVIDLDALGRNDWRRIWPALNLSAPARDDLGRLRKKCEEHLAALGRSKPHKQDGITTLQGRASSDVTRFLAEAAKVGLFLVPVGEVEQWLGELEIQGKSTWIARIFEAMGSDPASRDYQAPTKGDVWKFIDQIGSWIDDPHRAGMP